MMLDHRTVGEFDEGLREGQGKRSQSGAEATNAGELLAEGEKRVLWDQHTE